MKITFLGTCAGTEPMPGRRHTSFVVEYGGRVYWFDAGAGCSYTAHLLGIDLLAVRAVFISHTHMDHIGGLANLLWDIRKLDGRESDERRRMAGKRLDVFIPDLRVWRGIEQILVGTEGRFSVAFDLQAASYADGIVFEEEGFRVTALHNEHMGAPAEGEGWKSHSFLVEAEGRRLVFSGDIKDVRELEPLLDDCDLLLAETGHHKVEDICAYAKEMRVERLGFLHHGRAILADPEGEAEKARGIFGERVFLSEDGMQIDV